MSNSANSFNKWNSTDLTQTQQNGNMTQQQTQNTMQHWYGQTTTNGQTQMMMNATMPQPNEYHPSHLQYSSYAQYAQQPTYLTQYTQQTQMQSQPAYHMMQQPTMYTQYQLLPPQTQMSYGQYGQATGTYGNMQPHTIPSMSHISYPPPPPESIRLTGQCSHCQNLFAYEPHSLEVLCPFCHQAVKLPTSHLQPLMVTTTTTLGPSKMGAQYMMHAPIGTLQQSVENAENAAREEYYYNLLEKYVSDFTHKHSALSWLSRASPSRSFKIAIPKKFRVPKSISGQGGYTLAFLDLGLTLRESDTSTGHWHSWYAHPGRVHLKPLQQAILRRWKESSTYSSKPFDDVISEPEEENDGGGSSASSSQPTPTLTTSQRLHQVDHNGLTQTRSASATKHLESPAPAQTQLPLQSQSHSQPDPSSLMVAAIHAAQIQAQVQAQAEAQVQVREQLQSQEKDDIQCTA